MGKLLLENLTNYCFRECVYCFYIDLKLNVTPSYFAENVLNFSNGKQT